MSRRMAANSAAGVVFGTNPRMPAASARRSTPGRAWRVTRTVGTGQWLLMARAAAMPSRWGISRSSRAMSIGCRAAASTAARPSGAWAVTTRSGSRSRSAARAPRTRSSSSASRMRITRGSPGRRGRPVRSGRRGGWRCGCTRRWRGSVPAVRPDRCRGPQDVTGRRRCAAGRGPGPGRR